MEGWRRRGRDGTVRCARASGDLGRCRNVTVDGRIKAVNASLPSHKCIHRWVVTDTMPSIENGMLTRNLKYDRKGVYRHFQTEIERQEGR